MSRSKETFEKRQREKLKQQKKQNKLEKKDSRRLHNNKGAGLDSMIAYVDENGNLTTERPLYRPVTNN